MYAIVYILMKIIYSIYFFFQSSFKVFNACKPVIKKDSSCAQFLLPYILVHVICYGNQIDRDEIVCEVDAIIGNDNATDHVATLNGSILSEEATHAAVSQDLGTYQRLHWDG